MDNKQSNMIMRIVAIAILTCIVQLSVNGQIDAGMIKITGGKFIPLFGSDKKEVIVNDFYLDKFPVTVGEYLAFTETHGEYKKTKIKRLFAEGSYLYNWKNDSIPGVSLKLPVTYVSWFAAKEYCECQGKVLPTVDEWEYVGMADELKPDARKDSLFTKKILSWYEKTSDTGKPIGSTFKNYWGIYDMHGLTWEWTLDFNSVIIAGEGRNKQGDKNIFCGGGSYDASDLSDYAAFMRYAFRSSLKANYTLKNLGFRCAKPIK
ncbi:MAG: formylglycine-generating enzyme family protein [Chitinophagales bacterium]